MNLNTHINVFSPLSIRLRQNHLLVIIAHNYNNNVLFHTTAVKSIQNHYKGMKQMENESDTYIDIIYFIVYNCYFLVSLEALKPRICNAKE